MQWWHLCERAGSITTDSSASGTNSQDGVLAALQQSPALPCSANTVPPICCSLLCFAPCCVAWCVVQEGGRALVNLLFGAQSPSGRLPITWYSSSYTAAVSPLNLNMRPGAATGHPGRSYRCGRACVCMQYLGYKLCARGMSMEHV